MVFLLFSGLKPCTHDEMNELRIAFQHSAPGIVGLSIKISDFDPQQQQAMASSKNE